MVACGQYCQPTEVLREIELFPTSTRPARVDTDDGEGFIKGLGNPAGLTALISELVAAELGTWLGLQIPQFAIVRRCDIQIQMLQHHGQILPPMFFSKAVDGTPRDGSDLFLNRLRRPSDVARLIVFDTWIRNGDRYLQGSENSDNLLYVRSSEARKYDLVPIDHSHCFVEIDFETELPGPELVNDNAVYGLYPEFRSHITTESVAEAIDDLSRLDRGFVEECVNLVRGGSGNLNS